MPGLSIPQQQENIQNRISAIKTYNEVAKAQKSVLDKAGSSFSDVGKNVSSQLNKIEDLKKRYDRSPLTSMDRMLDFLSGTRGNGPETFRYLRKVVIQALTELGPEINKILKEETIKALGCSQEQTYTGINVDNIQIQSLNLLPISQGIYIPVKNIDISGTLKIPPTSWLGKIYYEKESLDGITGTTKNSNLYFSGLDSFKPYGGPINYPMNRNLFDGISNPNSTFEQRFGRYYNGKSGNKLLDYSYVNENDLGEQGDFLRVFLLDRGSGTTTSQTGLTLNNVSEFVQDYFATIQIYSLPQVVATVVNYLTNFVSIKANIGVGKLEEQSKFALLMNRILGLCFDEREEIDVSGISKIGELDGVDDSFFEFNEVDLRNIELILSDVKQGVVTFEDCDNVKLPVNVDQLADEIVTFSETLSGQSIPQQVESIENIIDSITNNPQWSLLYPNNASLSMSVNRNFIKQIPVALASSILNPKVLLPIFTMFKEIERNVSEDANDVITQQNGLINSANTILQSGTTIGQQVAGEINDSVDFIKKNRAFVIALVSKISALFVERLFEILKRDIFNLLEVIIRDVRKSQTNKTIEIILRLVQLGYIIARFVTDYRKCKSLLDEISLLLQLINNTVSGAGFRIPPFLNLFSGLLPGFSPERATLNLIEELEKLGIPTGPMPDGSPNFMNFFSKSVFSGMDKEEAQNGKVEVALLLPPPYGAIPGVGKKL